MSNQLAIANVTAAIGQIAHAAAQRAVAGVGVRYGRPNATETGGRVNVYLYDVLPNAAQRNRDLPSRGSDGLLRNRPTAALDLHYLLSFYGNAQTFEPDRMAGAVARDLHARGVLDRATLQNAITSNAVLAASDLAQSPEAVTITPMPLSVDDMSRLWSLFGQAPHTLSITYRAGVVLIDALEGGPQPLPVLRRGEDGSGVITSMNRVPRLGDAWVGFPDTELRRPPLATLRTAMLGTLVRIAGTELNGSEVALSLSHPRRAPLITPVAAADRSPTEIRLAIPDDAAAATAWSAGLYAVTAKVERDGVTLQSPVWPLLLAPRVSGLGPNPAGPPGSSVAITVTCRPQVLATQTATLCVGDRVVAAEARALDTDPLVFVLDPAPALAGAIVRLTVDGAESTPVTIDPVTGDFAFDDAQRLTIA